jgi:hypothetical protein
MNNKVFKHHGSEYSRLSEMGSKFGMTFSGVEVFGSKIIGLDGGKRKLLILEKDTEIGQVNIIRLDEVNSISVKKIYNPINSGELKRKKIHEFLRSIFLKFDFKDKTDSLALRFYESERNKVFDLPGLEMKMKNWQIILSKMIGRQTQLSFAGN